MFALFEWYISRLIDIWCQIRSDSIIKIGMKIINFKSQVKMSFVFLCWHLATLTSLMTAISLTTSLDLNVDTWIACTNKISDKFIMIFEEKKQTWIFFSSFALYYEWSKLSLKCDVFMSRSVLTSRCFQWSERSPFHGCVWPWARLTSCLWNVLPRRNLFARCIFIAVTSLF